jgi:hypothetical protein
MDNDRIAGSAREATETLHDGSRAVAKKVEEYRSALCWSPAASALRWRC